MKKQVIAVNYESQMFKEFDSLKSASEYYGITTYRIRKQCKENQKYTNKMDFFFVDDYKDGMLLEEIEIVRSRERLLNLIFGTKNIGVDK
ncbi:hypothetical protein [Lactococcus garvieae]|uniref:hypothetical protein n=1 Tax=Lactococcus garvieae TaxID=1363 RepID=UPI0018D5B30F|nr:hypothetical protein [Lactococcus garvieae]QPS71407.1 hypothetical protein I6G50_01730 [Lactococcus garvieae]